MLSKFNRETMKRAFMQARYETFNHLPGKKFQVFKFLIAGLFKANTHNILVLAEEKRVSKASDTPVIFF